MYKSAIKSVVVMVFCYPVAANATVINFDDISTSAAVAVADGYQSLNWSNFYALNASATKTSLLFSANGVSGYLNGMVTSPNVAYSGSGNPATFSSLNAFNFNNVYLTAAWYDNLIVKVTASLAGMVADTATFTVNTLSPALETLNWTNIDSVTFTTQGGTLHNPSSSIGGRQLVFDNLTISPVSENLNSSALSSVPVPAAVWLFGSALAGFSLLGKRSKT